MARDDWMFQFTVDKIAAAAKRMRDYHAEQARRYEQLRDAEISRAEGTTVKVARMPVTGGDQAKVTIDPTIAEEIGRLETKMKEHKVRVKAFTPWVEVFETQNPDATYELTVEDAQFFDLVGFINDTELEYVEVPAEIGS